MNGKIVTFTGKLVDPLDMKIEDIDFIDIAHALSMKCRWGGMCSRFYSVAEHSMLVTDYCSPENKLWALLHDAPEAYLADVPRPLKEKMPHYKYYEQMLMDRICLKWDLPLKMPAEVKKYDDLLLGAEWRDLIPNKPEGMVFPFDAVDIILTEPRLGQHPESVEKAFKLKFKLLK